MDQATIRRRRNQLLDESSSLRKMLTNRTISQVDHDRAQEVIVNEMAQLSALELKNDMNQFQSEVEKCLKS